MYTSCTCLTVYFQYRMHSLCGTFCVCFEFNFMYNSHLDTGAGANQKEEKFMKRMEKVKNQSKKTTRKKISTEKLNVENKRKNAVEAPCTCKNCTSREQ